MIRIHVFLLVLCFSSCKNTEQFSGKRSNTLAMETRDLESQKNVTGQTEEVGSMQLPTREPFPAPTDLGQSAEARPAPEVVGTDGAKVIAPVASEGLDGAPASPQRENPGTDGGIGSTPVIPVPVAPVPVTANYAACGLKANLGLVNYSTNNALCPAGEIVVFVNDGTTREMTCCPMNVNILSPEVGLLNQLRQGTTCGSGEVLTGMADNDGPVYCSRIDEKKFTLGGSPVASVLLNENSALSPQLKKIADAYNQNDTCMCPPNTIAVGGHISQDNTCGEQCVGILQLPPTNP